MSAHKFTPPKFIDSAAGYSEYKRKLQRWARITKVESSKQAEVVLYHLEGHPSGIQEKIDTALGDAIIDKEDGLKKLILYLDTIYAEDEMTEAWTKYKQFVRRKSKEQSVFEFIADFEKSYAKAKACGNECSDTTLAFNLLEACCLSETDEKFVLTAVDYKSGKQKKDLLDQVKNSLRKFQGRDKLFAEKDGGKMEVKVEDSYVTNVQESLIAAGWKPPNKSVAQGSGYKGKKNPLGWNGKPLKCFRCQSEYHMLDKCDQKSNFKEISKKQKKGKSKEAVESTMLSSLLDQCKKERKEYGMVCEVYDDSKDERVLVTNDEEELCCLVEEAGCRGVLDSACSKSVAGLEWIAQYTNNISPSFANALKLSPSTKIYQFGGGEKRNSKGCVQLPTVIGDKKVLISVDVVDARIPLLIGSNSMEAAGAVLNFELNKATFFDEEVKMYKVGSGHFCIDLVSKYLETHINDGPERDSMIEKVLLAADCIDVKGLKKLQHLYGHTSAERLLKFLQKAGKDTKDLRDQLIKSEASCDACIKSKSRKPRPKTALPRVDNPNNIVSIDLKVCDERFKEKYICYLIDMYSRFTVAAFIPDKKPDTVVRCIMQQWVCLFGVMGGIHSDIGGEMSNDIMEDVAHKLGVKGTTTASYSPHQNGLNERNHAVVDLMMTRMMASDKTLSPEMALRWALNAKNSLENCHGFSPYQLHIGRNPVLPSVTRDGPSSYENETKSESFATNLNAMHLARREFTKAESSAILKKALKSKIHPRGEDIIEGDWIYYKKNDDKSKRSIWNGPSKVTAVNGKKLFIDRGARLATVNRDDAVRVGEEFWKVDDLAKEEGISQEDKVVNVERRQEFGSKASSEHYVNEGENISDYSSSSESESEDEYSNERNTEEEEEAEHSEEEGIENSIGNGIEEISESENQSIRDESNVDNSTGEQASDPDGSMNRIQGSVDGEDNEVGVEQESSTVVQDKNFSYKDIRVADVIRYRIPEENIVETSRVLSRAAKSTGSNRFWWNVEVIETGEAKSVNTKEILDLQKLEILCEDEPVETLVVTVPRYLYNDPECVAAKEIELNNWDSFGVYKEVEDVGQEAVNTNWVLVKKGEGVKARLCIRGDQEKNKEDVRTDSPTVNKVNVKLFYVMAACKGWLVHTADVKAAFLQGADLERDVYVRPPKERRVPGVLWKMVKGAYGLVDASRGFYIEMDKALTQLGCKPSAFDPALYMFHNSNGSLGGMVLTHVDDLIHGSGNDEFHKKIMGPLKERFQFGREEECEFKYVGVHVKQEKDLITTDQDQYVEELHVPDLKEYEDVGDYDFLLNDEGQAEFRSIVGRIGWVANTSRPDLAYDNLVLSTKLGNASVRDMKQAIKITKKMKCDGTAMKFVNLGAIAEWSMEGYGDAGYKSLPDKISSCGGHVMLLCNKSKGVSCVLNWRSKKLRRVVSSSTAAEALSANEALDDMVYVKSVLKELLGSEAEKIPMELVTDSRNLHKSVMSSTLVENPRMRTDIAKLKGSLKDNELHKFVLVPGKEMLADVLTKKGVSGFDLMKILRNCTL